MFNDKERRELGLPPVKRIIMKPRGGWKAETYYAVDVAFSKSNPIFRAIFYSGFLNAEDKTPGNYNEVLRVDDASGIRDVHYMKVIRMLNVGEFERSW